MMPDCPLTEEEQKWLEGGILEFNNGRYWHAHEDWEELWKSLKNKGADMNYVLGIQGLIQTTALMFQYERKKARGCLSMWSKLTEKLGLPEEPVFAELWSIDIPRILQEVSLFTEDASSDAPKWSLDCSSVQIHRTD